MLVRIRVGLQIFVCYLLSRVYQYLWHTFFLFVSFYGAKGPKLGPILTFWPAQSNRPLDPQRPGHAQAQSAQPNFASSHAKAHLHGPIGSAISSSRQPHHPHGLTCSRLHFALHPTSAPGPLPCSHPYQPTFLLPAPTSTSSQVSTNATATKPQVCSHAHTACMAASTAAVSLPCTEACQRTSLWHIAHERDQFSMQTSHLFNTQQQAPILLPACSSPSHSTTLHAISYVHCQFRSPCLLLDH